MMGCWYTDQPGYSPRRCGSYIRRLDNRPLKIFAQKYASARQSHKLPWTVEKSPIGRLSTHSSAPSGEMYKDSEGYSVSPRNIYDSTVRVVSLRKAPIAHARSISIQHGRTSVLRFK